MILNEMNDENDQDRNGKKRREKFVYEFISGIMDHLTVGDYLVSLFVEPEKLTKLLTYLKFNLTCRRCESQSRHHRSMSFD